MKVPEPRKLDSGSYFIQMRLNGVSVPVTASTAKECKRQAELIKAEHRAGKRQITKSSDLTLSQAIDKYIDKRSNVLSPSTVRGYKTISRTRFLTLSDVKIGSVKDWQGIINSEAKTCNAKTLKNAWGFVKAVLRENHIEMPENIKLPQIVPKERNWLEPEQIKTFVAAASGTAGEISLLLALQGLRRSEIMGLTWENVNLKAGTLSIKGAAVYDAEHRLTQKETNKNSSSRRTIPIMIPELATALNNAENKTGNVVTCDSNTIYKRANKICADNGLPLVGVHGLRHSFASLAYHLGLSEMETMQLGGWSDHTTMHKIYTHLSQADRTNAENRIAEFFNSANENANGIKKP